MSAGICGKRLGFEEIFGSPAPSPSAKRPRCALYGSPSRPSDFGFGSEDRVAVLLRMFPSMDREVVETVLSSHDHKVDDAIKSLHALCLGDNSTINASAVINSMLPSNDHAVEVSQERVEETLKDSSDVESRNGSSWVDILVQEMMNASNWDDVRARAVKILEEFERSVLAHSATSKEQEIALLKEQLQSLLKENYILKKAVAIQHERSLEHDEKLKEVQQLKHIISQYQEQVRTLEVLILNGESDWFFVSKYLGVVIYFVDTANDVSGLDVKLRGVMLA